MCDRCAEPLDRRGFLRRAAIASGAVIGGGLVVPDVAGALAPAPLETVGLGEDLVHILEGHPQRTISAVRRSLPRAGARRPPLIVGRRQWGANEGLRTSARAYAPIRKLIIHHTASPTNPRNPASWVRRTYEFHVVGRGYSDMGYNFMIDHRGVIYEGRWARSYGNGELHDGESRQNLGVVGGHAKGVNTGTCGICLIGDFTTGRPTPAAIASLIRLLAWKCAEHRIDPLGSDRYVSLAGQVMRFPNIAGHRDVGNTICPGPNVFRQFPAIRQAVHRMVGSFPPRTVDLARSLRYNYTRPPSPPRPKPRPRPAPARGTALRGYRILTEGGRVSAFGRAGRTRMPRDEGVTGVVAIAAAPGNAGYYTLDRRGGVLAFGTAVWHGSLRSRRSIYRPVDIATRRQGDGYWILANNGGVFAQGGAPWFGSLSHLSGMIVPRKLRATPSGRGYWIMTANARISPFGDAVKAGSPLDHGRLDAVDFWPTPSGRGYWVVMRNGQVMTFGDARHFGDLRGRRFRPVAILGSPDGRGYLIVTRGGSVAPFGRVPFHGWLRRQKTVGIAPIFG
jgi:hypothetical protein